MKYFNNTLEIEGNQIKFPIRIKNILEYNDYFIVSLGFSAKEDCNYDGKWTNDVDLKWKKLHKEYQGNTLFKLDSLGKEIWSSKEFGFVDISKLTLEEINQLKFNTNLNENQVLFISNHDYNIYLNTQDASIIRKIEMR